MRKFRSFIHSLLLATSPSFFAYPQCGHSSFQQSNFQEIPYANFNLTYDEVLCLLRDIEEGGIDNLSEEQLEKISRFLAYLAQVGLLPGEAAANANLENDIATLFEDEEDFRDFAPYCDSSYAYTVLPALLNSEENAMVLLCKKKKHKDKHKHHHHHHHKHNIFAQIKDFVVKHKKAILIGAAIVIAATVVVVAVAAASSAGAVTAVGAAAGAAAAPDSTRKSNTKDEQGDFSSASGSADIPPGMTIHDAQTLKSTLDNQILSFKETVMQNQFFQPTNPATQNEGLSWEENGRALGSLFAHDSYNNLQHQLPYHPRLSQEIQGVDPNYTFFVPGGDQSAAIGHSEIDRKFSTDYSYLYSNPSQEVDFNTLSHQIRGERALSSGYYNQAIQDLGKAIETNPINPIPYLERGIAHFSLGQYDRSLEDYEQFTAQSQAQKPNPLSVSEFSLGFAKGLPNGVYESGEGLLLFMADFVKHPIQTSTQIVDSVTTLVDLVCKDEWGIIAKALSPEVHQLVTQWDTLPSEKKGELAGYAVGKNGTDILAPGALAKVASKSVKSAQELAAVCKNLQIAQETLILETAAGIGNSAKIAEVVETGQKTVFFAEELGFTGREMGQLKQAGQLESTVKNTLEHLSLPMQESFALHTKAKEALKPYVKKPLPEFKVRELIHETGIPTFPKPNGIPENYIVTISGKGAGMKYIHPQNEHTCVRVMPGKPHSPLPHQQKPYVVQLKDGMAFDKHGNLIDPRAPEAHIPIEEFIYRE